MTHTSDSSLLDFCSSPPSPLSLYALVGSNGKLPSAFKHSVHMDQGLECITCHAGVNESVKGTDNLLPVWSACADCHSPEDVANKGVAFRRS